MLEFWEKDTILHCNSTLINNGEIVYHFCEFLPFYQKFSIKNSSPHFLPIMVVWSHFHASTETKWSQKDSPVLAQSPAVGWPCRTGWATRLIQINIGWVGMGMGMGRVGVEKEVRWGGMYRATRERMIVMMRPNNKAEMKIVLSIRQFCRPTHSLQLPSWFQKVYDKRCSVIIIRWSCYSNTHSQNWYNLLVLWTKRARLAKKETFLWGASHDFSKLFFHKCSDCTLAKFYQELN